MPALGYGSESQAETLTKKLKVLQDNADNCSKVLAECDEKLKAIEKSDLPFEYSDSTSGKIFGWGAIFIVGMAIWGAFSEESWWVIVVALWLELKVFTFLSKQFCKQKVLKIVSEYEILFDKISNNLYTTVQSELLPMIHALVMFTIDNAMEKTPAKSLREPVIQSILDDEIKNGRLEKITLYGGSTKILYKSLQPEDSKNMDQNLMDWPRLSVTFNF